MSFDLTRLKRKKNQDHRVVHRAPPAPRIRKAQNLTLSDPAPTSRGTMAASNSGGSPLSAQPTAALSEVVGLVFGRWTVLQMAVENQWGGRDSRAKADQLGTSILSWFCRSKGWYYSFHSWYL
jgi:hypothetical protein